MPQLLLHHYTGVTLSLWCIAQLQRFIAPLW